MMKISPTHSNPPDAPRRDRSGFCQLMVVLFVFVAPLRAIADDTQRTDIQPDPAIQTAIARVAEADNGAQQQTAIQQFSEFDQVSRSELIRQLVYFGSRARNTKAAMTVGVALRRLDAPDDAIARALAPCLETTDAEVAKSVRNILGGLEKRTAGRRPDFSVYHGIVADCVREGEPLPDGLIRYMYDADAGMAMLTLMRAHQLRAPEEVKAILWAEHVVADVLWKQQYGFLAPNEIEPAALVELSKLARHNTWWARLYVAEVMRQNVEFRRAELIGALARDVNELVRATAAEIETSP